MGGDGCEGRLEGMCGRQAASGVRRAGAQRQREWVKAAFYDMGQPWHLHRVHGLIRQRWHTRLNRGSEAGVGIRWWEVPVPTEAAQLLRLVVEKGESGALQNGFWVLRVKHSTVVECGYSD